MPGTIGKLPTNYDEHQQNSFRSICNLHKYTLNIPYMDPLGDIEADSSTIAARSLESRSESGFMAPKLLVAFVSVIAHTPAQSFSDHVDWMPMGNHPT